MATKRQIIDRVFELISSEENQKKLKDAKYSDAYYYYMMFLGLEWDYTQSKYSMALNLNKFTSFQYRRLLEEIEKICK